MKKTLVAAVLALAVGPAAWAVDTCNGLLAIDFVNPPAVVHVGDTLTVKVTLGTGPILGGTSLTITKVFYDRDCAPPLAPDCTPLNQGAIQFAGNASTNCPVVLTPVVDSPNRNAFTASLTIPANKGSRRLLLVPVRHHGDGGGDLRRSGELRNVAHAGGHV